MITKFDIGVKWSGQNFGNQLFQVASQYGLAKRYDTQLLVQANWSYLKFFELLPDIVIEDRKPTQYLVEQAYEYCIEYFDQYRELYKTELVNIDGVLQSEKYWKHCESDVRRMLTFKRNMVDRIAKEKGKYISEKAVAISVRRGDFITNPNHYLLPFEYYYDALTKYFPGHSVVVFTDDFKWCKKMFGKDKNLSVHYSDAYSAVEQLCFMSMFSNFIIANSTFSWWGAYLSDRPGKRVVRPHYVFDGPRKNELNIKDHYPPEWIEYKHEEVKRSRIKQFLFYNDNTYRIKSWSKGKLLYVYNKVPFKGIVNKIRRK